MASFVEVFDDVTKLGRKIPTTDYAERGAHPIIDQGQDEIAGYTDETEGLFEDVPAIIFGDHTRAIKYVDTPCFLGADGVKLLKAKIPDANYRYLYYVLQNARIPNTGYNRHFKWLKEVEIPLPDARTQRNIVAALDKVTALIALRKQQIAKLDELVKARFVEMFGDPKDNHLNWDTIPLGSLFSVGSSKRIYQNEQVPKGIPFLRISDLMERIEYGIDTAELFISKDKFDELRQDGLVPKCGDILVTSRGTLGRCYEVKSADQFYFQDGMISWLSERSDRVNNTYIMNLFSMPGFRKQIDDVPAGSTVNYLSLARLKSLQIMCPPIDNQHQFAAFVAQTDQQKLTIQHSLDKLELLKKALMQKYFG